jgi:hypothetical protein
MEAKGLDAGGKILPKAIAAQLIHSLRMQCLQGKTLWDGKKGTALMWKLP